MNLKKIYRQRPDIKEKVEALYPAKKGECRLERAKREGLQWERAKILFAKQPGEKVEYES